MKNTFKKEEIKEILSNYNLGKFKKFKNIKKDDVISFGQVIETTKGKYFMKVLRYSSEGTIQGIRILNKLQKQNFPTYKTFPTKSKKLYLTYKNKKLIFYEYIPNLRENWKNLNIKQIKDFGKTLAKFHKLTKSMKIKKVKDGTYEDIKSYIHKFFLKRKRFSKKIQKVLEYMEKEIKTIKCPKNQYLTGYFSEFNPGHVFFKNNKVKYIIDWEIGKANAFFDYGSSMVACFNPRGTRFYSKKLKEFISAYDKERPLSNWEKDHLFEAFKFGVLKYGIWGFIDLKTGKLVKKEKDIDTDELNRLKFLIKLDKDNFLQIISSF